MILGFALVLLVPCCVALAVAPLPLAREGRTEYVVVVDKNATIQERHAARELSLFLKQVTGAEFLILSPAEAGSRPRIAVGAVAAKLVAPSLSLDGLGADGIILGAQPPDLILTGAPDAPRGALYAVYTFLEDYAGCRWWTRSESSIPCLPTLDVPGSLDFRYVPVFERRDQCFMEGLGDKDWPVRMKYNGWTGPGDDAERGGTMSFAGGMCHTFYLMVPPQEHFAKHPEWYSEIDGKRTHKNAQLCLTNPELTAFVIEQARALLRKNPKATFVSMTQNDCAGYCQCPACKAIDDADASPSGTMIRFANAVGDAIAGEFPHAAVDTFAYQYTRRPPRLTKPRSNVVVRLCSIECDFAHPLEHENNRAFCEDMEGWAKICSRLYVWDYVTDFANYIQPHPNLRVLGPNVRFFAKNNVKGVFEQGNYQSLGGEFGALRAWVLGKLLWNPELNDKALMDEFLKGYYGDAAPFLRRYIELLHDRAAETGFKMGCFTPVTAPYLDLDTMMKAEALFQQAEKAVANRPDILQRVRIAHLPVRYVFILRWSRFRMISGRKGMSWQAPLSQLAAIDEFEKVCAENNITLLSENTKRTIGILRQDFAGNGIRHEPNPPAGCEKLRQEDWIDIQDD